MTATEYKHLRNLSTFCTSISNIKNGLSFHSSSAPFSQIWLRQTHLHEPPLLLPPPQQLELDQRPTYPGSCTYYGSRAYLNEDSHEIFPSHQSMIYSRNMF